MTATKDNIAEQEAAADEVEDKAEDKETEVEQSAKDQPLPAWNGLGPPMASQAAHHSHQQFHLFPTNETGHFLRVTETTGHEEEVEEEEGSHGVVG